MTDQTPFLKNHELADRYTRREGRIFLTGMRALFAWRWIRRGATGSAQAMEGFGA